MSSLSSPVQAVVALYSGPLEGVRFADIDAESLGNLATEVETISAEVEALEAQLGSLREALAQKEELLLSITQQALAYARIYAESDEALTAELNEIALPKGNKPRKSAGNKSSERGARASKDAADGSADEGATDAEVVEAEPVAAAKAAEPAKGKRRAAVAEVEAKEEPAPAAKAGRRKLPTRSGRAAR